MARVLTNDSSNVTGRIGDVVYVRYKGGTYIRKAPKKRRDANDPKMLLNQHRFACITRFCVQFKHTLIPQIWNDVATTSSGYNLFLKANSPAFARDGTLADPLLLKLSTGSLSTPEALTAQRMDADEDTIEVSWTKETHLSGTRSRDELMAVAYDGKQFSAMVNTGIKRRDAGGSFALPIMGQQVQYLYLFFAAEDRRGFSESAGFKV